MVENRESQVSEADQELLADLYRKIQGQSIQDFFIDENELATVQLENGVLLRFPMQALFIAIPNTLVLLQ